MSENTPPASSAPVAKNTNAVFVRDGVAWSEVTELGASTYRLRLGGLFRTAWLATLCSGLADRRLSIDYAHARRGLDRSWIAELNIVLLPGATDPKTVPYIQIAEAEIAHPSSPLELSHFELIDSTDHGGTLKLTIEAHDALGLLGTLLASLATLMLFPVEMHIDTRAGRAHDCLWLGGIGASNPSSHARDALQRLLSSCVRTRT